GESTVKHAIASHFPALPEAGIGAEFDGDLAQAKEEVRQRMHDPPDAAARLHEDRAATVVTLDQRVEGVVQCDSHRHNSMQTRGQRMMRRRFSIRVVATMPSCDALCS